LFPACVFCKVKKMASVGIERAAPDKGVYETTAPELGEQQHEPDIEAEPEMINIDRIEKVYA
jgi:hypothetical protein